MLRVLRAIAKELRHSDSYSSFKNLRKSQLWNYLESSVRKNRDTTEQYCRHRQEQLFLAETYLALLQSSRQRQELINKYHGKGTRSVEETAKLVGLKVPENPNDKDAESNETK